VLEEPGDGIVRQFFNSRIQVARPAQAQKYSRAETGLGHPQRAQKEKNEEQAVGGIWLVHKNEGNQQDGGKTQAKEAHKEAFLNLFRADVAKLPHIQARAGT